MRVRFFVSGVIFGTVGIYVGAYAFAAHWLTRGTR